jgi:hypothetical protein
MDGIGHAPSQCSRQFKCPAIDQEKNQAAGKGKADPGCDGAQARQFNSDHAVQQQK